MPPSEESSSSWSPISQAPPEAGGLAEELLRVVDAAGDGLMVLDCEWRVVFANESARRIGRIGPKDLNGLSYWELYPEMAGTELEGIFRRAMEERVPTEHEFCYQRFAIWMALRAVPITAGLGIFLRDVTAQRQAAEELRRKTDEAERKTAEIEAVYRTAPIGLALFDPVEFRYLRLNERQASFFGLKPEQVLGRRLTEMAPIEGLHELFEQVLTGRPVVNFPLEGTLITNPDEHRYWTVNYFPVYAPDGSIQGITAASLEVTQQKRAEMALIQSEKLAAAGRLASSISHEINNPLESVVNLLYLLQVCDGMPRQSQEYVEMAQAELARVSQIVTQTLRFYRQTSRPARITAAQVVLPVIELFKRRLTNAHVEVETHLPSTATFCCLEGEIRQVLSNLVSNAIDALPDGGRIVLHARDAVEHLTGRRGVRISVGDNGAGMMDAVRRRIFEPFYTTKELNGTGLGLWISTEIVERHKGRLTVRSTRHPRRHGTVFSLFLPLNEGCEIHPPVTQPAAKNSAN
ncbi:MAG TPA: PAS domain-containing sensor histidine kinase [Acidobacteriaceae bacterium]